MHALIKMHSKKQLYWGGGWYFINYFDELQDKTLGSWIFRFVVGQQN